MEKLKKKMMELVKDEEGATMVEYGLMVALIAVVCIVVIGLLGGNLNRLFGIVNTKLTAVQ